MRRHEEPARADFAHNLTRRVHVAPGLDLDDLWERFEVFEALHHDIAICNPMSDEHVDDMFDVLDLHDKARVLDVACGSGEVLIRAAERADIAGTGVDLSPWMIQAAARRSEQRVPRAAIEWVLADASAHVPQHLHDVVFCIGAEWVWHDFAGTARALAGLVKPDGLAVIGSGRLHSHADQRTVRSTHGFVESIADQRRTLEQLGFRPVHRIDPTDADWDRYLARTARSASRWAIAHPGERSGRWIEAQREWMDARERDRGIIGWSLWIARCGATMA